MENFGNLTFWGNTTHDYIVALGVLVGLWIIFAVIVKIALVKLAKASAKTGTDIDDFLIALLSNIKPPFYFFVALYLAAQYLSLPGIVDKTLFVLFLLVVILQSILAAQKVIDYIIRKKLISPEEDNKDKEAIIRLTGNITKALLWILGILMVLSNLGINVTSLITGLGIGGIAIALALQNVLGDMFASFSIFTDKPFKVGDFIIVGDDMGTVEKIGIKSTRITTLEGQELIIPNKTLSEERINNYGRMKKRRVQFSLGVTYSTAFEKLGRIPEMVENIIKSQRDTQFDRAHFKRYGDSSLDFEVVYYVESADYNRYMDTQQAINLAIFERFAKEGIEFAFPSRTVYLEKE